MGLILIQLTIKLLPLPRQSSSQKHFFSLGYFFNLFQLFPWNCFNATLERKEKGRLLFFVEHTQLYRNISDEWGLTFQSCLWPTTPSHPSAPGPCHTHAVCSSSISEKSYNVSKCSLPDWCQTSQQEQGKGIFHPSAVRNHTFLLSDPFTIL